MIDRRRMLMLGAATAGALAAGCARGTVLADPAEPLPPIGERIGALERRHNATVGLYATNLVSGKTVTHRDSQPQAICSTFKGYLAARVLQMTQTGQLSLQKALFVDRAAILPNSPFTEKRVNLTMTIEELCQAVLQQSDNAAANMLLREIGGPPAITAFARSIGDETTRLDRWEIELNTAIPGDPRDTSTPRALADGYRAILTGDVLASDTRALLDEWMRANQTSSMRAGLPPGWTSADKTGSGDYAQTNDVGIAYGPGGERLLLAILTRTAGNDAKAPALRPLIGEVTTLVVADLLA